MRQHDKPVVLFVDDTPQFRAQFLKEFEKHPLAAKFDADTDAGFDYEKMIDDLDVIAVVSDYGLKGVTSLDVLCYFRRKKPKGIVIIASQSSETTIREEYLELGSDFPEGTKFFQKSVRESWVKNILDYLVTKL